MTSQKVASREEWLAARAALLEREKAHTRMSDELAQQRRELPWLPVERQYTLRCGSAATTSTRAHQAVLITCDARAGN